MIGTKIQIQNHMDSRGILMAVNSIPFEAKRMFFIFDVPQMGIRGEHFSRTSSFFYVVINGSCKVELDNGSNIEEYDLETGYGLLFSKNTWMKIYGFTPDAILCVLADTEYRADDYVSNYEEFLKTVRGENV